MVLASIYPTLPHGLEQKCDACRTWPGRLSRPSVTGPGPTWRNVRRNKSLHIGTGLNMGLSTEPGTGLRETSRPGCCYYLAPDPRDACRPGFWCAHSCRNGYLSAQVARELARVSLVQTADDQLRPRSPFCILISVSAMAVERMWFRIIQSCMSY